MNSDLVILLGGVGMLLVLAALWVWHYLFRKMNELETLKADLLEQFKERRDVLPYLLESYRTLETKQSSFFQKIVTQRAEARNAKGFESVKAKEKLLGEYLNELFLEAKGNTALEESIAWLEAKTEIQKMSQGLEESLNRYQSLADYLKKKKRRFPYLLFVGFMKKVS